MLFSLSACGLLPSEVDVEVDYPLMVAGSLSSVQPEPRPGVGSEVRQTLSNEGVPVDRVDAVRVTALELIHLSPRCEVMAGCDLEFVESLELFVESPGLERERLGSVESPGPTLAADMRSDDLDLAPFLRAESMTMTAKISLHGPPIQDVEMEIRATLTVEVDI